MHSLNNVRRAVLAPLSAATLFVATLSVTLVPLLGCDSVPPAASPDAAMIDRDVDAAVSLIPYPDAAFSGSTDAGQFDAPVPSVPLGEPCATDLECLEGRCRMPTTPGVASTCAAECDAMNPCAGGALCGTDGLCALDNPLGGVCADGLYDANGDPSDGCEYACAGRADYPDSCNGIDDDCDTRIDEAATGVGASCEVLGCGMGTFQCLGGVAQCVRTGVTSMPDGCDGTDNDCDGVVDEGCALRVVLHDSPHNGPLAGSGGVIPASVDCPASGSYIQYVTGSYGARFDELDWICRPLEMRNVGDPNYRAAFFVEPPVRQELTDGHTDANAYGLETPSRHLLIGMNVKFDGREVWGIQPLYQPVYAFQRESSFRYGATIDLGYHGNPSGPSAQQILCGPSEVVVGFYGASTDAHTIGRLGLRCQRYHVEPIAGP
jgi:hypothetical protein